MNIIYFIFVLMGRTLIWFFSFDFLMCPVGLCYNESVGDRVSALSAACFWDLELIIVSWSSGEPPLPRWRAQTWLLRYGWPGWQTRCCKLLEFSGICLSELQRKRTVLQKNPPVIWGIDDSSNLLLDSCEAAFETSCWSWWKNSCWLWGVDDLDSWWWWDLGDSISSGSLWNIHVRHPSWSS